MANPLIQTPPCTVPLEPRPYQDRVVAKVLAAFRGQAVDRHGRPQPPVQSAIVESPTGSGKTVMALRIAKAMQEEEGLTVGWTAMRRNLLAQAGQENRRPGFNLDLRLISMFDKHPPQTDLLIIDEAQHDGALSMANLHSAIKPQRILGLTATPFRSDSFKLCFETWVRDAGIHCLIQDGYLSPYHHYTIPRYEPRAVAEFYAREPQRWGQSLIFFRRYSECVECLGHLQAAGVAAEVVTGQSDREGQIEAFAAGRLSVLVNMLVLSEGFDCPSLQTVFCRPSGKLCTIQMAGRVFRRHPSLPFKQIVQCEQTRYPFPRTATPAEQYLWCESDRGGQWRLLRPNRHIDEIGQRMQEIMAMTKVSLPRLLAHQSRRTAPLWRGGSSSNRFPNNSRSHAPW